MTASRWKCRSKRPTPRSAKLARVRDGEEVQLSGVELSSLFRYRAPLWAVSGVEDADVEMYGDTLVLSGRVATDRLPSHPELDRIRPLLPESSRIEITGQVRPYRTGSASLNIEQVQFAGIPIPARYYPEVLDRIGREESPGLGADGAGVAAPRRRFRRPRRGRPADPHPLNTPMARILVVDDEEGIRRVLSQLLEYEGHEVRSAAQRRRVPRPSTPSSARTSPSWT